MEKEKVGKDPLSVLIASPEYMEGYKDGKRFTENIKKMKSKYLKKVQNVRGEWAILCGKFVWKGRYNQP